jgi:hypothetical protein
LHGGVSSQVESFKVHMYRFNELYNFQDSFLSVDSCPRTAMEDETNTFITTDPRTLVGSFFYMRIDDLRKVCRHHSVYLHKTFKMADIRNKLLEHCCSDECPRSVFFSKQE